MADVTIDCRDRPHGVETETTTGYTWAFEHLQPGARISVWIQDTVNGTFKVEKIGASDSDTGPVEGQTWTTLVFSPGSMEVTVTPAANKAVTVRWG